MSRSLSRLPKPSGSLRRDRPDQPLFGPFLGAALAAHGCLRGMGDLLGLSSKRLHHRLSLIHGEGAARTVTLYCPVALGLAHHSTAWVRLRPVAGTIARFEGQILADPAVTSAQRLVGAAEYRLTCFHPDPAIAREWLHRLRCDPDVLDVQQVAMRRLFGHELDGFALTHDQG